MHRHLSFIPDGDRFWFRLLAAFFAPILDAEKRSRGDYVIASVQRKGLQRRTRVRALLDLIKKDQRAPRNQFPGSDIGGNLRDEIVRLQATIENLRRRRFKHEVELDEALILLTPELLDNIGLADLPRPLDQKTLAAVILLPTLQSVIELAFQLHKPLSKSGIFYQNPTITTRMQLSRLIPNKFCNFSKHPFQDFATFQNIRHV